MSKVQKARYGSFNLLIASAGEKYIGHIERATAGERLGEAVTGSTFDEAVMAAKLEALRLIDGSSNATD